jgi:multiple sugar transport system permease protein
MKAERMTAKASPVATSGNTLRQFHLTPRFRDNVAGWLFVFPAALLVFVFGIFPIGYAAYMSLFNWRIRQGAFFCDTANEGLIVDSVQNALLWIGGCLEQYRTNFIGDWWGMIAFCVGFVALYGVYRLWTWPGWPRQDEAPYFLLRFGVMLAGLAVAFAIISYGYSLMLDALRPRDRDFLQGLQITFYYAFGSIPLQLAFGLILAYVLHGKIRGKQLYRMLFFLPYVTPTVAAAVVFGFIFSGRDTSLANQAITALGFPLQRWLSEPRPFVNVMFGWNLEGFLAGPSMALVCVILLGIWTYTGYNAIIFMAGLGNIPTDLYEAAKVDGASEWHLFRYITLPLLSPVTFYLSILGFIGTFTAFNTLFVMRTPASQGTLDTAALVIFDTFREQNRWGEAAAQAIVLMLIVLALTQVQRSVFEKQVFYG